MAICASPDHRVEAIALRLEAIRAQNHLESACSIHGTLLRRGSGYRVELSRRGKVGHSVKTARNL